MSNSAAPLPLRFFDFLRKPDGDMNMDSGVVPYIEEGFASAEFVEASVAPFQKPCHFFLSDLQSVVL
jgi:hypothetical protein